MNQNEILEQRKKGVFKDFQFECEPKLCLTIQMPSPMEYDKASRALNAKNSELVASVIRGKTREQLQGMKENEALEMVKDTGGFLNYADDTMQMKLDFFEKGMPNGWKLDNLSYEEFAELKEKITHFFEPNLKTGGNTPISQNGETPLKLSQTN